MIRNFSRKRAWLVLGITVAVALGAALFLLLVSTVTPQPQSQSTPVSESPPQYRWPEIKLSDLVELTNEARASNGVAPLAEIPQLDQSASDKCQDMVAKDYYQHDTPDGSKFWSFIKVRYPEYVNAGENLAAGGVSAKFNVDGWMNSPSHRKNILETRFTKVGFGICKAVKFQGKDHIQVIVQHFAG